MKRIITLLSTMLLATTIMFAQQQKVNAPGDLSLVGKPHLNTKVPTSLLHAGRTVNTRSAGISDTLLLDYSSYDQLISLNNNRNWNGLGSATPTGFMNSFVDSNHVGNQTVIAGIFDTVVYVNTSNVASYIPTTGSTITVDSIGLLLQLIGPLSNMLHDSIVLQFYTITNNTPSLAKTIVFGDTASLAQFEPTTAYIPYNTIPVGLQLAQNQTFAVSLTYLNKVDTSYLAYFYTYSDSCGTPSVTIDQSVVSLPSAYPTVLGAITQYDITLSAGGSTYAASAVNNLDFGYFSLEAAPNNLPANCAYYNIQDLVMYPIIHINTPYSAAIAADYTISCPNGSVNLTASVFGTNTVAGDLGYNWSSSSNGLLSGNGTSTNQLTIGTSGNVTVTLTVTDNDNNSATTVDTIVITNAAPTVSIANLNNFTTSCTSPTTLVAHSSGSVLSQAGLTYLWSDGTTGSSIVVNSQNGYPRPYDYAGTYNLTVTNVYTCSSTATATVTYSNNATNQVSFTHPNPVYDKISTNFVNTSSSFETPWTLVFDPDNTGQNLQNSSNGSADFSYTYPSPGTYTATLIMDSAGCKFAGSESFQVRAYTGISNLAFDNNVTLVPNPSNGNVILSVTGVEKTIAIQVYNLIGEEVKNFSSIDVNGGTYSKSYDFSDLPSGAYMVKVQSAGQIAIKKMLITK